VQRDGLWEKEKERPSEREGWKRERRARAMPRSYNGTACRGGRYFIIDTLSSDMREENRYLSNLRNESADTSRWENWINVTASNLIESQLAPGMRVVSLGISIKRTRDVANRFLFRAQKKRKGNIFGDVARGDFYGRNRGGRNERRVASAVIDSARDITLRQLRIFYLSRPLALSTTIVFASCRACNFFCTPSGGGGGDSRVFSSRHVCRTSTPEFFFFSIAV